VYVVVRCPRCGGLLLGKMVHRTRSCPHCGHRMALRGLRVLGRTGSPREAVALIQALKEKDSGRKQ
jgi:DNA-directed RNA polymerase subunit RPC12/RpoP